MALSSLFRYNKIKPVSNEDISRLHFYLFNEVD